MRNLSKIVCYTLVFVSVCVCLLGPTRLCLCVAPVVLPESMVTSAGVSK